MNNYIKNYNDLATNKSRKAVLDIVEAGYDAIDTKAVIKNSMQLDGTILTICDTSYDLADYEKVYIVGAGKIACQAAIEIENILQKFISGGAVIGIKEKVCQTIATYAGTHPIPSKQNCAASEHIMEVSKKAGVNDLVIVIIGGGGSALLCSSIEEYKQDKKLYESFLSAGGTIEELNTVRKHLSKLKGGGLAKILHPATVVGLIFSDIPGDNYGAVASGPTYFDETVIADAQEVINKYKLGKFNLTETPKDKKYFERIKNIVLVSNKVALRAMGDKAVSLGYKTIFAGSDLYSFPEEVSEFLVSKSENKTAVIAAGEVRLIIPKECNGIGGRNDFLALEMLSHIHDNQTFASFASDGKDNTSAAGAIVDINTKIKLDEFKIDLAKYKKCFDSHALFQEIGGLIITGQVEANVSDLMVLLTE